MPNHFSVFSESGLV